LDTDAAYAKLLFRKWIIGTARRIVSPGSTLDGCVVLQGPTGVGKTAFFRGLLPAPFEHRTGEIYADLKSPTKITEALMRKSVASFDELGVLEYEGTAELFKSLLTMNHIDVRLAWARAVRRFDLRVGLGATTNKERFIADAAMARRLWVIKLNNSQRLNFDYYNANKKALWQEALYLAEHDESCLLSLEEQKVVEANNASFMLSS
jgi:predicted P-loop ATPase